jgi:hypothetical protein
MSVKARQLVLLRISEENGRDAEDDRLREEERSANAGRK